MRIQHNIMAMNAYRNYNLNTSAVSKNLEKLSSGYRINRAGDDAAGLAISEKMRAQITGLKAASKNVKDGISLVKTAEGAMQEVQDMLNRMVDLATQSANGTYDNETDRAALQAEIDQLNSEIDRIADSANFNGIKLLDGSLATTGGADKVEIFGVNSSKSNGSKAIYQTSTAFAAAYGTNGGTAEGADGDVFTFNIGFEDGTSQTVQVKLDRSEGDGKNKLTSMDGKITYGTALAADGVVANDELGLAIESALKSTSLAEEFDVKYDTATGITLTAKNEGTDGRVVKSFDMTVTDVDGNQKAYAADPTGDPTDQDTATIFGVKTTLGRDEGREIDASNITEYNGTNYDEAVFTINGKKFVVLANELTPSKNNGTKGTNLEYLRATEGLGSDVTILVGGIGGLMDGGKGTDPAPGMNKADADTAQTAVTTAQTALTTAQTAYDNALAALEAAGGTLGDGSTEDTAVTTAQTALTTAQTNLDNAKAAAADRPNDNFAQNIKKIAEVTGLKVTGTVDGDGNNIGVNAGIRLSKGEGKNGGLVLQIGDTSDSFNQLRVGIDDIHAKALGVDKVSVATQEGAQMAIDTIKTAINKVSTIRGTLGATQNRLEHTQNNLSVMTENIQDAESSIRDTDIAEEMMAYTKNNILVQSAQAMLAQANQIPQGVLQLLG